MFVITPVILIPSDVILLIAITMESVDRENIIIDSNIENKQPTVICHTCQVCAKSFSTESALKQHGHVHEELKRFQCFLCQRTAGKLKKHNLVHKL
jgi:uncharacterized Zn-finger protein